MSGYSPTPAPPRAYELVRACMGRLDSDAELQNALGSPEGTARVYAQRQPGPGERPARLVVIRIPRRPGGLAEGLSRIVRVPLQVMVETAAGDVADLERFHAAVQERVHTLLVGYTPVLDNAHVSLPVERTSAHGAVFYDAVDEADYSTADYQAVLSPKP